MGNIRWHFLDIQQRHFTDKIGTFLHNYTIFNLNLLTHYKSLLRLLYYIFIHTASWLMSTCMSLFERATEWGRAKGLFTFTAMAGVRWGLLLGCRSQDWTVVSLFSIKEMWTTFKESKCKLCKFQETLLFPLASFCLCQILRFSQSKIALYCDVYG